MNRRRTLVAVIVAGTIVAAVAWRARHRIRDIRQQFAENSVRDALQITPESGALPEAPPVTVGPDDSPWWRARTLVDDTRYLPPLIWSEAQNVAWKTAVPGRGHSSPCILGDQIFLTTALDADHSQHVLCFSLNSGKVLWDREVHQGQFIHANAKNTQASSTPATDGSLIFTLFPLDRAIWLSALTPDGGVKWQTEIGPFSSKEGFGASPLIAGDFVIVAADNMGQSWIAAVHRLTGQIVWRTPRGGGNSYGSPALLRSGQNTQIVMAGLEGVAAYELATGEEIWRIPGPINSASTPAIADGMIFLTGCTPEDGVLGIRAGSPPQTIWKHSIKAEVPSPLYDDGLVYVAQDLGILNCFQADSGDRIWRKRLEGNVSSSPIRIGDRVMVSTEDGVTVVFKTGDTAEVVNENRLNGGIFATPVPVRDCLVIRTIDHLYCIAQSDFVHDQQSRQDDDIERSFNRDVAAERE